MDSVTKISQGISTYDITPPEETKDILVHKNALSSPMAKEPASDFLTYYV